ncbi:SH3 domain-containing protein [Calothrix rhizosoleniae]|uniref:SH3 domain-containing protein n=1 Tax=Calothrix rhizosoleniae TaxID=888997 RepID=UPI00190E9E1B|nr:SH3 domain-containing protein [Calothrix rhizosoleniae]
MKFQASLIAATCSLPLIPTVLPAKADIINAQPRLIAAQNHIIPTTYMTRQNENEIAVQIQEGEFNFRGTLRRTQGSMYIAEDWQVRVMYDTQTHHVVVINKKTGTEYYNYVFSMNQSNNHGANASTRIAILKANNPNTQINLRTRPTINSSTNGYGVPGDRVQNLECRQDNDRPGSDLNWCRVRFLQSGAIGWIRSDFINFPSDGF